MKPTQVLGHLLKVAMDIPSTEQLLPGHVKKLRQQAISNPDVRAVLKAREYAVNDSGRAPRHGTAARVGAGVGAVGGVVLSATQESSNLQGNGETGADVGAIAGASVDRLLRKVAADKAIEPWGKPTVIPGSNPIDSQLRGIGVESRYRPPSQANPVKSTYFNMPLDIGVGTFNGYHKPIGTPLWQRPATAGYLDNKSLDSSQFAKEKLQAPKVPLRTSDFDTELNNRGWATTAAPSNAESVADAESRVVHHTPNRVISLHEATHALDPALDLTKVDRNDPKAKHTARLESTEVPAMTTEMLESIRQGYKPESNLWIEQMKKHGPKLTGNDTQDVANIEQWMKQLRGDTTLGRKYKDWLAQYGNGAEPLPRR